MPCEVCTCVRGCGSDGVGEWLVGSTVLVSVYDGGTVLVSVCDGGTVLVSVCVMVGQCW